MFCGFQPPTFHDYPILTPCLLPLLKDFPSPKSNEIEVNFISPDEEANELLAPALPHENNQILCGASFTTHNLESSHVLAEGEGLKSSAQLSENAFTAQDEKEVVEVGKGSRILAPTLV